MFLNYTHLYKSSFVVLFVIAILTIVWFSVTKGHIEKFEDAESQENEEQTQVEPRQVEQTSRAKRRLRRKKAIESCDILRPTDDLEMDGKSQDMMRSALDGHRINAYKPQKGDPVAEENGYNPNAMSYCYMYNDRPNNMQDYMLDPSNGGCSMNNILFKNMPFINKVYSTPVKDDTHAVPVEKCVLEMDGTKITTENLNAFWGNFGESSCEGISEPIRTDIKKVETEKREIEQDLKALLAEIEKYGEDLEKNKGDLTICQEKKQKKESDLKDKTTEYHTTYEKYIETRDAYADNVKKHEDKTARQDELTSSVADYEKLVDQYQELRDTCRRNLRQCRNTVKDLETHNNRIIGERDDKIEEKKKLNENLQQTNTRINEKDVRLNTCERNKREKQDKFDALKEDHKTNMTSLASCEDRRAHFRERYEYYKPKAETIEADKKECLEVTKQLRRDIKECDKVRETCRYHNNAVLNAKNRYELIARKLKECQERLKQNKRIKKQLEEHNVDMYNRVEKMALESEEIMRQSYKDVMDTSKENTEEMIKQHYKNMETIANDHMTEIGCQKNSETLKKIQSTEARNAQLRFTIQSMDEQTCYYCYPSVKQCAEKFANDDVLCHHVKDLK